MPKCFAAGIVTGMLVWACNVSAAQTTCPGADLASALRATPTCAAAHALHQACSPGSSFEWEFAAPVMEKCEAAFLAKLTARQKDAYKAKMDNCSDVYARENEGTGAAADVVLCQEEVAAVYAKDVRAAVRAPVPQTPPVAASFDCALARSPLEKTICSSRDLGDVDMSLRADYVLAMRDATREERHVLALSESEWLRRVARICFPATGAPADPTHCVLTAFGDRSAHLASCAAIVGPDHKWCLREVTPVDAK